MTPAYPEYPIAERTATTPRERGGAVRREAGMCCFEGETTAETTRERMVSSAAQWGARDMAGVSSVSEGGSCR